MTWHALGTPAPNQLAHTREQLHCVLQAVASVPRILVPPAEDWSHSAFSWDAGRQALVSAAIPAPTPFHVALRLTNGTALVLDGNDTEVASLAADGVTIEQLFDWLTRHATSHGATLPRSLADAEEQLPHPCVAGQRFDLADRAALEEIARYFDNTNQLLKSLRATHPGASPILTWPHHIDIATLLPLQADGDPATGPSISFGMEPGDDFYPDPYFYSSPSSTPETPEWPSLAAGGAWHTEGFTGAVLHAATLVAAGDAEQQQRLLETFAASAIEGNRKLITQ